MRIPASGLPYISRVGKGFPVSLSTGAWLAMYSTLEKPLSVLTGCPSMPRISCERLSEFLMDVTAFIAHCLVEWTFDIPLNISRIDRKNASIRLTIEISKIRILRGRIYTTSGRYERII